MNKRILIIATSSASMGAGGAATGVWAEELAVPYYALVDAGCEVEIATTRGGPVPIDPSSLKPRGENDPAVDRLLGDEAAQAKVRATRAAAEYDMSTFDAVFFPGGHGAMWDMPGDAGVTRTVETALASGKPVAAVCHGVAGLVSARGSDGQSVVHGKRVNSFTDAEEKEAGKDGVVPFLLESRLRELGGRFEGAANWQAFAVRDGLLITGQNPQSSEQVARMLVEALGEGKVSA